VKRSQGASSGRKGYSDVLSGGPKENPPQRQGWKRDVKTRFVGRPGNSEKTGIAEDAKKVQDQRRIGDKGS